MVYGEIYPEYHLQVGSSIRRGQVVGWVTSVLVHDNGRPSSMLHVELHEHHALETAKWDSPDQSRPDGLLNPTDFLLDSEVMDQCVTEPKQY